MTATTSNARVLGRATTPEPSAARAIMCPPPPPTWGKTNEGAKFVLEEQFVQPMHSNGSRYNLFDEDEECEDYDCDTSDTNSSFSPSPSPESLHYLSPPRLMNQHERRVIERLMNSMDENRQFEARRAQKRALEHWVLAYPLVKDASSTPEMREAIAYFRSQIKRGLTSLSVTAFDVEVAAFAGRTGGRLREVLLRNASPQPRTTVLGTLVGRLTGKRKRQNESEPSIDIKRRKLALAALSTKLVSAAELEEVPGASSTTSAIPSDSKIPASSSKIPSTSRLMERAWRPVAGCARAAKALGSFFIKLPQDAPSFPIHKPAARVHSNIVTHEIVQYVRAHLFDLTDDTDRRFALQYWAGMVRTAQQSLQTKADMGYIERGRSPVVKRGITSEPRRPSVGPASRNPQRV